MNVHLYLPTIQRQSVRVFSCNPFYHLPTNTIKYKASQAARFSLVTLVSEDLNEKNSRNANFVSENSNRANLVS